MKQLKTVLIATAKCAGFYAGGMLLMRIWSLMAAALAPESIESAVWWPVAESAGKAAAIIAYYYFVVRLSRGKGREKTGIAMKSPWFRHYALGVGLSAILVTLMWSVLVAIVGYEVEISSLTLQKIVELAVYVPEMALMALCQECLYRGVAAFSGRKAGKIFCALLISCFFAFAHAVESVAGFSFYFREMGIPAYASLFLFSLICFELTWITGSLWSAAGFHSTFYAFSRVIYGIDINGQGESGLLTSSVTQISDLLTGGSRGLVSSYICVILLAIGFLMLWILYRNPNRSDEPLANWMIYGDWVASSE